MAYLNRQQGMLAFYLLDIINICEQHDWYLKRSRAPFGALIVCLDARSRTVKTLEKHLVSTQVCAQACSDCLTVAVENRVT